MNKSDNPQGAKYIIIKKRKEFKQHNFLYPMNSKMVDFNIPNLLCEFKFTKKSPAACFADNFMNNNT